MHHTLGANCHAVLLCIFEACDTLVQKNEEINDSIIQCSIGFNVQYEDGRISIGLIETPCNHLSYYLAKRIYSSKVR